jgi:hypothetical protein
MTLPELIAPREKLHTRHIVIDGYKRADGFWDIEGQLTDVRHRDIPLATGTRLAGTPLHEMLVRITVDDALNIVAAAADTRASPYPGTCEKITPDYARLVGLRIEAGFRQEVARLFGGLHGCTHITELLGNLATAAVQTVAPETEKISKRKPRKLDGCHALDSTGPVVAHYYPAWHRKHD